MAKRGKRGNGEGSVFPRSDGRWGGAVSYVDAEGITRRRTVYGKTRKEAAEKLRALQQLLDAGLPIAPARETVGAFLERYLADVVAVRRRAKTTATYRSLITHHLAPTLGRIRLDRLRPEDVQRWQRQELDAHMAARSVAVMRAILSGALDMAVRWGLVARNVVSLVDGPAEEAYEAQVLSEGEGMEEDTEERPEALPLPDFMMEQIHAWIDGRGLGTCPLCRQEAHWKVSRELFFMEAMKRPGLKREADNTLVVELICAACAYVVHLDAGPVFDFGYRPGSSSPDTSS